MDPDLMAALFGANPGTMGTPAAMGVDPNIGAGTPTAGAAFNGGGASNLLAALKGVPAMQPPQAQKVATPNLPKIEPIKGGNLMALLQAMNLPGQQAMSQYKLPSTLEPPTLGFRS